MWIYEQYFIDFLSNNCSSEEENINLKKYFMNYLLIEITVSPRSLDSLKLIRYDNQSILEDYVSDTPFYKNFSIYCVHIQTCQN